MRGTSGHASFNREGLASGNRTVRLALLALGAVTASALLPASALAVPTWLSPTDLSAAGQNAIEPQVAVDPQGDAVAIWKEDGTPERVQSAERAAGGGTWSAPVDLSADGEDAHLPQLAVDAEDEAVAVWLRSDGSDEIAQGAVRTPGGVWSTATDLSAAGNEADYPEVAVDPAGHAVAVGVRYNATEATIQGATR